MCSFEALQGLTFKKWITILKSPVQNHPEPISQFVLPESFVHKVVLACHDDNGHLGMQRTNGLLQERFFWPKMADDRCIHIYTSD